MIYTTHYVQIAIQMVFNKQICMLIYVGPIVKNDKFFKILKNTFFDTLKYVQNDGKTHSSQKY